MLRLAIGIIEVIGLSSAIEVADICVKSANVTLIGYELSQGHGMVLIKIEGDVGAVTAAVQASSKIAKVLNKKVIPRPGDGIECLIKNENTVGYEDIYINTDVDKNDLIINKEEKDKETNKNTKEDMNKEEENDFKEDSYEEKYTCNLCKDPKCPREKGDLRVNCIHYDDKDTDS
ncbi:BMC domain-containing protein [Terrisporobacter glycolicus]|uniref:BMC domain-containing protein n=1 Tax=Terrisporobacter glycolicus ATCC 14880 = DSM 1288 TaxID=1121315 RepID=A0ABZ2ER84_9FIRM|nr:BMC domain-containing protein [Terrisporobacter glycolicus]